MSEQKNITSEDIYYEMAKIDAIISTAYNILAAGNSVDLSSLQKKVQYVCSAVINVSNEDKNDIVNRMEVQLKKLEELTTLVNDQAKARLASEESTETISQWNLVQEPI